MATFGNYYIDAPTLAGATAVFTDVEMTIAAPDGYYSDGTTVRQQVGGLFGNTCGVSFLCTAVW